MCSLGWGNLVAFDWNEKSQIPTPCPAGSKMSKQKNKSDFKAKSMAEMEERRLLVVEILASAAEMVL